MLDWVVYILLFAMFISVWTLHFGITLICYITLFVIQFFAEYFGWYSYHYRNYELIEKVHNKINSFKRGIKEASETYNYFYNSEV